MADFKIQGLEPVLAKMKALAPALKKKALRSAGTKAMRPVRDAVRRGTSRWDDPSTPESNITKNVVTRYDAKASRREGGSVTKVGVMGGARVTRDPANTGHWRHKEMGTSKMPADPVFRDALSSNVTLVTNIFVSELDKQIDKIIAKGSA